MNLVFHISEDVSEINLNLSVSDFLNTTGSRPGLGRLENRLA